jgi:transcriptional regulator
MIEITTNEKVIIQSHAFAQIMSSQAGESDFSELVYCPLKLTENYSLLGHLSANNSLLKVAKNGSNVKVTFSGPHGYISPRWHDEQLVPTWNYASVSMICALHIIDESSDKLRAMEEISHYFDPQWDFKRFSQSSNTKMVQHMLKAITVFTLEIIEVKSKFKLSKNRSNACRLAFNEQLYLSGNKNLAKIQ